MQAIHALKVAAAKFKGRPAGIILLVAGADLTVHQGFQKRPELFELFADVCEPSHTQLGQYDEFNMLGCGPSPRRNSSAPPRCRPDPTSGGSLYADVACEDLKCRQSAEKALLRCSEGRCAQDWLS